MKIQTNNGFGPNRKQRRQWASEKRKLVFAGIDPVNGPVYIRKRAKTGSNLSRPRRG